MIPRTGKRPPLALLLGCVLLLACGTKENHGNNASPYPIAPAAHVPTSVPVRIVAMKFDPDTVRVQRGDTVVFINQDVVDHDVTALPDSAWSSHILHPSEKWTLLPDRSTDYFCSIHVVMRGYVEVQQ